jgi:AhpD family alkylhydroperoxidase
MDTEANNETTILLAVAVACITQCPCCLDVHTRAAGSAGATREEVAEAAQLATALRAGPLLHTAGQQ